jgi:hypothetical protein
MARTRSPLYQGDETGLCGLYAVVNSLRLLWPREMTDRNTTAVFQEVAHALGTWPRVLWAGTYPTDIVIMLKAARRMFAEKDMHLTWTKPFKTGSINHFEVFETNLRHELDCPGTAAIVGMNRPASHWSVLDRFTRHTMVLADSSSAEPIRLANCALFNGRFPDTPHKFVFDYPYTFVIRRDA